MIPKFPRPLLIVAAALGLCATAQGYSPARPYSYTSSSEDGRFTFVLISPLSREVEASQWNEGFKERIRQVREKYPASGMYRNDGSTQPLWTVNWYAWHVDVASDGAHVIANNVWGRGGITFVANGSELRSYETSYFTD